MQPNRVGRMVLTAHPLLLALLVHGDMVDALAGCQL